MHPDHLLRLFLVEDSAALRDRLAELLGSIARIQIVGFSDTEQDAINQLRQLQCDAVVLDLQLKNGTGLNVLKAIRIDSYKRPRIQIDQVSPERGTSRSSPCTLLLRLLPRCQTTFASSRHGRKSCVPYRTDLNRCGSYKGKKGRLHQAAHCVDLSAGRRAGRASPAAPSYLSTECDPRHHGSAERLNRLSSIPR